MRNTLKNKRKKLKFTTLGFTLIELLAVIVILAIIALIATPVILGIINNVKDESNKRSIELYAEAIETAVAKYQLNGKKLEISELKVKEGTNGRKFENSNLEVEYDGNVVCEIINIYEDGKIYLSGCDVDNQKVNYKYGIKQSYENGEIVYFDVETGKGCINYHEDNSMDNYNGIYKGENSRKKTDNQNSCLKFYAFNDGGGEKINLLLDHNTTAKVAWTKSDVSNNTNGPINVITNLKNDTKEWNVPVISKDYQYKGQNSYSIKYNTEEYKARLITAQEIAIITGADKEFEWKEESSSPVYYFYNLEFSSQYGSGDLCATSGCKYGWLYDRTSTICTRYGCLYNSDSLLNGYWTSTAVAESYNTAWTVSYKGYISSASNVQSSGYNGVRPVIEVLKSSI